ncbi:type II secretion system protein GspE [Phytobacter sp. V91]|uniref:type II secretion system protein GspE n=1 Tax=Phytobacter sp. V91 TaxID=3369425 RepID=UPI003F61AF52
MQQEKLKTLCKRHRAILLNSDAQMLNIAVVGEPSTGLLEALRFATPKRVGIECWTQAQMDSHFQQANDTLLPVVQEESGGVVALLNQTLEQALAQRASDIHFEPAEHHYRIRLRVDGVLHSLPPIASAMTSMLTARLKVLGNLDIAERRVPQDGQFSITLAGQEISFRIATLPCRYGEKVVLRLLHQVSQSFDLNELGMSHSQLRQLQEALNQPQGLILVTGPTTVTLYSALQVRNNVGINICSVEDPVKIPLTGLNQTQINPRAGLTFQSVLRALLRQDPDIIMIGEIRDGETAEIAIKAAQTGHLVLSTLHTNSTTETLVRIAQMGVARWIISSALSLVIAQRLVRKLCPHCRQQRPEKAAMPVSLWPRPLPRWQAIGCERCYHGFYGRVALFEVLEVDSALRQAIADGTPASKIEEQSRKAGMTTLFQNGCLAVEQGLTSIEEILRVLGMPDGD